MQTIIIPKKRSDMQKHTASKMVFKMVSRILAQLSFHTL
jgi:hypothetical protein